MFQEFILFEKQNRDSSRSSRNQQNTETLAKATSVGLHLNSLKQNDRFFFLIPFFSIALSGLFHLLRKGGIPLVGFSGSLGENSNKVNKSWWWTLDTPTNLHESKCLSDSCTNTDESTRKSTQRFNKRKYTNEYPSKSLKLNISRATRNGSDST